MVSNAYFQRFAMDPLILRMIASDPDVATAVAANFGSLQIANVDTVGEALLCHSDTNVRLKLAESEGTPMKLLNNLRHDSARDVAQAAHRTLRSRFGCDATAELLTCRRYRSDRTIQLQHTASCSLHRTRERLL